MKNELHAPLSRLLREPAEDARLEKVHRRLRATRDSFVIQWGWHVAIGVLLIGTFAWSQRPPAVAELRECVVIIRPAQPAEVIGESC